MKKDTICHCGHWDAEHVESSPFGCASCDECKTFVFDPDQNTAESIFDRGGEHGQDCECAACKYTKEKK